MDILFWEIRQYLRPFTLIAIGVLTLFWTVMYGNINRQSTINRQCPYQLSVEYQQRFGDAIDRAELEEIKQDYAEITARLDALYDEYAGEYGVHSKEDYDIIYNAVSSGRESQDYRIAAEKWGEENLREIYEACESVQWSDPVNLLEFQWQAIGNVIEYFELLDDMSGENYYQSDAANARLREYQASGEVSLLQTNWEADSYFWDEFQLWALLIDILCAVIVVPVLVSNRVTNVQAMQFASRQGRAILKKQLAAALLIITAVNLAADAFFCGVAFFGRGNTRHLLNCSLNTGALKAATWIDMTYLQYAVLMMGRTLLLSLALTCGLFIITYFFNNYIASMAFSVLSVVWLYVYSRSIESNLYLACSPSAYPLAVLVPIALIIAVTVILMRKIRQMDYVYE